MSDAAPTQGSGAAAQDPGLDFAEKVVVLVGGVAASMALTVLNPVLPAIEKALAHGPTDQMLVKQLFGAATLAMVAGAPLGGFLVARLGMRRLLLIASLVFAIAGTAGLYLSSLPLLLVSRLFVGASAACIQVMSFTLVNTRLDGQARAKWMGYHISMAIFCSLAIFPLSGFLGDISWRLPFSEYLFGLLLFAAMLFGRDPSPPRVPAQGHGEAGFAGGPPLMRWMPWHYVVLSLLVGAIAFLPTIYMPYLFRERAQLEPSGIAGIMTLSALVGGIAALLYGRVRGALSTHAAFIACFGLAAIGLTIIALGHSLPVMIVGLLIYGTGNAWAVPNVMTSLGGKLAGHQQARAAGIVKAGHFVSTPLMVVLVEPYARQLGAASVILLSSGMAAFIVLLMLARMATGARPRAMAAE